MKVVLAMCIMAQRTGAEWFVRDLALALNASGHSVIVFAPIMGDMVDELRRRCIACVTDLREVAARPDVIIGNTRDETVACLAQFPGVPAIAVCHDRTAPHGQPPLFSRIRQYVAVDANCAERLTLEHGIPESRVQIIQNGVDLERFRPRPPLPARPQRAAIFSNYATESEDTRKVRDACSQMGIELEVIGSGVGRQAAAPEDALGRFDLVFAKARCAMEAMAMGCAVILLNEGMGMGGLVTRARVEGWHRWNFGRRLLQAPIEVDRLKAEIAAYSVDDAAAVSAYLRSAGSLQACASAFARLAALVADEKFEISPAEENREFARHLMDNLHPYGTVSVAVQVGGLREQLAEAGRLNERLVEEVSRAVQYNQVLTDELARVRAQLHDALEAARVPAVPQLPAARDGVTESGLRERIRRLEGDLSALQASRSWRLTAPLRWLAGRLGL